MLSFRSHQLIFGKTQDRGSLKFKYGFIGTVQDGVTLDRQPPAERIHGRLNFLLADGEQIKVSRNVFANVQFVNSDQLHAVIGLNDHASHTTIGRDTPDNHVLSSQLLLDLVDPAANRPIAQSAFGLRFFDEFFQRLDSLVTRID